MLVVAQLVTLPALLLLLVPVRAIDSCLFLFLLRGGAEAIASSGRLRTRADEFKSSPFHTTLDVFSAKSRMDFQRWAMPVGWGHCPLVWIIFCMRGMTVLAKTCDAAAAACAFYRR